MDGPWGHYAKWNKSGDGEVQIQYDFTHMWNLKIIKSKWTKQTKQTHIYREQNSSRITVAEERISDLEDRKVEITAMEQNKEKEWK